MTEPSLNPLSAREIEILERVATGATNQQIAVDLDISINTVKAHLRNIFAKLEVESRTEATLYAIQFGLVEMPGAEGDRETESAGSTAAEEAEQLTALRRAWPISRAQQISIVLVLALVVLVALWPGASGLSSTSIPGRMVDVPAPSARTDEAEGEDRWQVRAQMPTPRGRFAIATLGQSVYVIGGLGANGWTSRVEVYDPHQDLWGRRTDKPTAVANVGAAVVDGLIYVPGGLDQDNAVRDLVEIYAPISDSWSQGPALPRPLCAYAIAPYGAGFYLFGGWDGERYLDAVYYYDAEKRLWHMASPLRIARGFGAATTVEDRIYLLGGYDGAVEYALVESYDPQRAAAGGDPWLTHTPMRIGRAGHSVSLVENSLYVVGGGWDQPFSFNERYDLGNDIWSTLPSPLTGEWRTLGTAVLTAPEGSSLYAIGGWHEGYLGVVYAYRATYRVFLP
jgi:DNA-binding CsgD family transcriptional regulator